MQRLIVTASALLMALAQAPAVVFNIPMDQQVNLGHTYNSQSPSGDAIYPAFNGDTITFDASEGGFTRHHLTTHPGGWWYQYVDLNLAGITTPGNGLNLSGLSTIEFDVRFFQDPMSNTNPYGDAPVFTRIYTYAPDGDTYMGHMDYNIVYATQPPWNDPPYPDWTHVTIGVTTDPNISTGGSFDLSNVSRVRFYGTDWSGGGDDFVDFRNLKITTADGTVTVPDTGTTSGFLVIGLCSLFALCRQYKC